MNRSWIFAFGLLLLTAGCSEPAVVAKVEKSKSTQNIAPENVEKASEPANTVKATTDKTEVKSTDEQAPPVDSKLDAHAVLEDAIAKAKTDDKALLVHFSADW